jgi:hypothetical protein
MRIAYTLIIICLFPLGLRAQFVINRSGNWTDSNPPTTPWQGGVPASTVNDMVTMDDGFNVTVIGTDNITSGSLTTGNNNTLTVQPGGTLTLGDMSNMRDLTAGTSMTITVQNNGTIIIWGNLIVNTSLIIAIQGPNGKIIIKGNVSLADDASLTVNGDLEVDGSFTAGMNTNVTVGSPGSISVYGPTTVGAGSNVIGSGSFHTYGGCTGPGTFCSTAPVQLIFFGAEPTTQGVKLSWSTASELNVDSYIAEKSIDGRSFSEITTVPGHGTATERNDYTAFDTRPSLGKNYYRLTEVDLDGTRHTFRVVEVDYTGGKGMTLYPNPISGGQITLELNFVPESDVLVSIVDLRGKVLTEFVFRESTTTVPLQLAGGIYVMTVRSGDFRSVNRVAVK